MEAGALIVERTRVPYVVGCVLPSDVIHTRLESNIQIHQGSAALELEVCFEASGENHHLQLVLPYAEHRDFLHDLTDASALYLLTGNDHPTTRTICNRINQGGIAIELKDALRCQIKKTSLLS